MPELENCKGCGRLFVRVSSPYCPDCLKEQEKMFEIVYKFIRRQENRTATVPQVHEATGVKTELIYQWIREGRLETTVFPNLGYPCRSCGKLIQTGTLCDDCRGKLERDIESNRRQKKIIEEIRGKTYHTERHVRRN
ncbi:hypothetical protein M3N64_12075 [Sporolactobacillus sp. CPB3-1]|uniref:Flagellar protein n=1 Tax=Sporolactobacillus mangiferae TaxID=2940498 RepID=A0ABT0MCR0_9BACL|nr:TIGR03826 family flagellar region protein [Sporolactobacillus mangiferae]MCL1632656.1 hypothetical protein [Sporolactobacillus mangiferae]